MTSSHRTAREVVEAYNLERWNQGKFELADELIADTMIADTMIWPVSRSSAS